MNMKKYFGLALVLLSTNAFAQSGTLQGSAPGSNNQALDYLTGSIEGRDAKLNNIKVDLQGSAYTTEDFNYTTLHYDNELQGNVFYRYNAYHQEVEIKELNIKDEPVRSLAKDKKISIVVDGKPMSFRTFIDKNGKTTNGYLMQLSKGKYNLFKRVVVKYTEGQKAQNSFVKAIPARFSKFTEYYFFEEGAKRMDEIELKNRKLLKLIPADRKESLKAFMKEKSLNIKDPKDLDEVFAFLNKQ